MKDNRVKVSRILSIISMLIFVFTLSSCAILGLSTTERVQSIFVKAQRFYELEVYDAAIEKYEEALKEFGKPGVTLGRRAYPHINENFPTLVNRNIANCRSKLVEQLFLEAEESYHQENYRTIIEKYKDVLKEFKKHKVTFDRFPHIDPERFINYRIANSYSKLAGQLGNSEDLYSKAITHAERAANHPISSKSEKLPLKTEIKLVIATAHFGIGKMYSGKQEYRKALSSYQLALQNAVKQTLRTEIQLAMVFVYFNQNNTKNALIACKYIFSGPAMNLGAMLEVDPHARERLDIAKGIQFYLEAENATFLAGYKGAVAKYNAALIEVQENISTIAVAEYRAELSYILGDILYKVERFEPAEQQLTKVIEDFPDSNFVDDAWYAIGDMNYKLQSYLECRHAFRELLDGFPNSDLRDAAQYFSAKSMLEELDYEGAYLAFNALTTKAFQKYPDFQDDARYHAAYCLNLLSKDDMAISQYENFLMHHPKSSYRVDAYFDLGTIYARQQNYDKARSNYASAMQHTDDQALLSEIQMAIGHAYYNQGDYKNAIVAHTSLLEKYPESDFIIEAKLGIANSHFRMRVWPEAADAYERVINEHPEATNFTLYCAYQIGEAHYGLATHHNEQGSPESAVENFHKALEWYQKIIDELPTETSDHLGEITELLITSLTRMRNDPSIPEKLQSLAQLKKGDSYLATKQYGKALGEYNTFVQTFPNSTRGSSAQNRIKQVQDHIISKNLQQEKVRTKVQVPIAQQIAQKALVSTVLILTKESTGDPMAIGSGFFISKDQIVSNWHVVEGATSAYALSVDEKTSYNIEGILAMNPKQDLVILKVSGESKPLPLGNSNVAQIGESIYVTGNPQGWTGTFSIGVISSFQMRYAGKRIQITAPVSPGSSGGPVLNDKGEVIGIVYAGHGGSDAQNLNLAIPVNYLKALLKRVGPPIPLSARE